MNYRTTIKSLLDFLAALIAIIILSPILITVTALLFFTNHGKPFFYQKRPGKNEKIFTILKFKSMNDKTDAYGALLSDSDRLTPIGKFVRQASIDELLQLFNVLKGDMSLIGPRPLLIQYLPFYTRIERKRHSVKPGLTGLAQVNGRNFLDWDPRLKLDVEYVENMSFKNDFKILLKTIYKVIASKDISNDPFVSQPALNELRSKTTAKP